jgi:hypothetical protein
MSKEKAVHQCEFCGEIAGVEPDYQPWKIFDGAGTLHIFCSYLCALRFFGIGRRK